MLDEGQYRKGRYVNKNVFSDSSSSSSSSSSNGSSSSCSSSSISSSRGSSSSSRGSLNITGLKRMNHDESEIHNGRSSNRNNDNESGDNESGTIFTVYDLSMTSCYRGSPRLDSHTETSPWSQS